jgi:hypothetical protein
MKTWHLIALLGVLGLVMFALVAKQKQQATVSGSNAGYGYGLLTAALNLGNTIAGKVAAPSMSASGANALPSDAASVAVWNATSSETFAQLAAQDRAAGVEGPF